MAGLFSLFSGKRPSDEVAQMISELAQAEGAVRLIGVAFRVEGRRIHIGDHHLEVSPCIEHSGVRNSQHICGVRFETSVNGKKDKRLTYGWVGGGPEDKSFGVAFGQHECANSGVSTEGFTPMRCANFVLKHSRRD